MLEFSAVLWRSVCRLLFLISFSISILKHYQFIYVVIYFCSTFFSLLLRFYLFACAKCNHDVEFIRRLHMNIEEVVHLLLFNLTLQFRKRYYNLTNVIYPYARDNWHALQLPPKVKYIFKSNERHFVSV